MTRKHLREGGPADRVGERFGAATLPRPDGPVVWLHAVSVGEAFSVLGLADALRGDAHVVLTTTSVTSAALVAGRLPAGVVHQFAPIDAAPCVAAFLDHWRPSLMVLTESEVWPVTLHALDRRGIPVAMVNGRMSAARPRGWRRFAPRLARAALSRMALIRAQDDTSRDRFAALGARPDRLATGGTLKAAAAPLPVDPAALAGARDWLGDRPVWVAASTHPGEEEILLAAHARLRAGTPDALLILAIRHPNRGDAVADLIRAAGLAAARRSAGAVPDRETAVYLADTLGEMGLWFSLAPVVFMAGSLRDGIGGHNPVEPAQFRCRILTGPHVANAADLFAGLTAEGAARTVPPEPGAIAAAVRAALEAGRLAEVSAAARPDAAALAATADSLRRLLPGG